MHMELILRTVFTILFMPEKVVKVAIRHQVLDFTEWFFVDNALSAG